MNSQVFQLKTARKISLTAVSFGRTACRLSASKQHKKRKATAAANLLGHLTPLSLRRCPHKFVAALASLPRRRNTSACELLILIQISSAAQPLGHPCRLPPPWVRSRLRGGTHRPDGRLPRRRASTNSNLTSERQNGFRPENRRKPTACGSAVRQANRRLCLKPTPTKQKSPCRLGKGID